MISHVLTRPSALRPLNLREGDSIRDILNTIGVKYSHHNDEVLLPSWIEEERTKKTLTACCFWVVLQKCSENIRDYAESATKVERWPFSGQEISSSRTMATNSKTP